MSAWNLIAQAVANKHDVGVEAKDRLGSINEDRAGDKDVSARAYNSDLDVVKNGGSGIGGNAVAKFGDIEEPVMRAGTSQEWIKERIVAGDDAAQDAADAFAAILTTIKQAGLYEEVLTGDDLNWATLAEGFRATFARDRVTIKGIEAFSANGDVTTVRETSEAFNTDHQVRIDTITPNASNGGGVRAEFEEIAQADAFVLAAAATSAIDLLGEKGGTSGSFKDLALDMDATFAQDTFTFSNKPGRDVTQDTQVDFKIVERDEVLWSVGVGGQGIGGNAIAKFESEAEAVQFETFIDQLVDLGLGDQIFQARGTRTEKGSD